jgi:hypothetical protein
MRRLGQAIQRAGSTGAADRLREELAAYAKMSVNQFMALPEAERDQIIAEHTAGNVNRAWGERPPGLGEGK